MSEKLAVVVPFGALDGIVQALNDLGSQRFDTLPETIRVHNLGRPIRDKIRERDELRRAIIGPYVPDGQKEVPAADLPEAHAKLRELWLQEVTIEIDGPPLDLRKYLVEPGDGEPVRVNPKPNTITDLVAHGLVVIA